LVEWWLPTFSSLLSPELWDPLDLVTVLIREGYPVWPTFGSEKTSFQPLPLTLLVPRDELKTSLTLLHVLADVGIHVTVVSRPIFDFVGNSENSSRLLTPSTLRSALDVSF
jgi:hypothetical protein